MPKKRVKPVKTYLDSSHVKVVSVPGKGKGLVARQDIPLNARLIYRGRVIDQKQYDRLEKKHEDDPSVGYTAYIAWTGKKGEYMDANPRYSDYDADEWIAGRVNEPSKGEKANMLLATERLKAGTEYRPVMIAVKRIPAGTELTTKYGDAFDRVGYKAGQRAVKPSWL